MKKLNFAVEFISTTVFENNEILVDELNSAGRTLGYVCTNKPSERAPDLRETVTPFTTDGCLPDEDCAACAARALFAVHAGLEPEAVRISVSGSSPVVAITALLAMSALVELSREKIH